MLKKLLLFAAFVEIGTGVALLVVPQAIIALLITDNAPPQALPLGRVAGIAMLALGVACWPRGAPAASGSPAFWGMLIYNALIALYLVYLSMVEHLGGVLLWPAVALHAAVALLLVKAEHDERRNPLVGA
jgi:hypothetical protein